MKLTFAILVLVLAFQATAPAQENKSSTPQSTRAPAQENKSPAPQSTRAAARLKVTGSYSANSKSAPNSMEVLELPDGKIKLHILALWVSHYNAENVHNGEIQSVVDLIGNTAAYKDDHCSISLKFTRTAVVVKQADEVGDCDFGANVTASGTYRKVSSRKPKFDF
ncbi:MAG TPA: hypothetical protein VGN86_10745 [Pyrinomonadaceae bacterium]|nr:hypothetical protein [Pyrinomonadaceae bacterium]